MYGQPNRRQFFCRQHCDRSNKEYSQLVPRVQTRRSVNIGKCRYLTINLHSTTCPPAKPIDTAECNPWHYWHSPLPRIQAMKRLASQPRHSLHLHLHVTPYATDLGNTFDVVCHALTDAITTTESQPPQISVLSRPLSLKVAAPRCGPLHNEICGPTLSFHLLSECATSVLTRTLTRLSC